MSYRYTPYAAIQNGLLRGADPDAAWGADVVLELAGQVADYINSVTRNTSGVDWTAEEVRPFAMKVLAFAREEGYPGGLDADDIAALKRVVRGAVGAVGAGQD